MTPKNPKALSILSRELLNKPINLCSTFTDAHMDVVRLRFGLDGNEPIDVPTIWKEHKIPLDVIQPALEHAIVFMAGQATNT